MALADIPGLGAYLQERQLNQQAPLQQLRQVSGALGLSNAIQAQQDAGALRDALAASGGDPGAALKAALASGNVGAAAKLAPLVMAQQKASAPTVVPPDSTLIYPNGSQKQVPGRTPKAQTPSNLKRLQDERAALQPNDPRIPQYDRAIKLLTDRQPAAPSPSVTQVVDPTNQTRMLTIDAKLYKGGSLGSPGVIGVAGKVPQSQAQAQKLSEVRGEQKAAFDTASSQMDRLALEANTLLKHPGLDKATGLWSDVPLIGGLATIPGTDAANFKTRLDTLKSQIAFATLQALRNASKTGGALGQVSNVEEEMLMNNLAPLKTAQSPEAFRKALQQIIQFTQDAKDRLRGAYEERTGQATPTAAPAAGPAATPQVMHFDAQGNLVQ